MSKKSKTDRDTGLLLVRHLYDDEEFSEASSEKLLQDPDYRHEYEVLSGVTQQLQSSSSQRQVSAPKDAVRRILSAARVRRSRFPSRPIRLVVLGGIGAAAACILLAVLLSPPQQDKLELQWDDTLDRIQMQQTLTVMRQRTSPDLWDESEVMTLDSLAKTTRPGIEVISTNPHK